MKMINLKTYGVQELDPKVAEGVNGGDGFKIFRFKGFLDRVKGNTEIWILNHRLV